MRNIYASGKGHIRLEVLKNDLQKNIISGDRKLHILDAGGGMGQIARWFAEKGHRVCMADISARMLEIAREENKKSGLSDRIELIHASIQELAGILAERKFDLVLLHGVMAWMQKPFDAIIHVLSLVKKDGVISVLFFNKDKLLLKNALNGTDLLENDNCKFEAKQKRKLTPVNPVSWQSFFEFCNQHNLAIHCKTGVRIFYGFFSRMLLQQSANIETFLALELKYCRQEPFCSLGEHTHCILSKNRVAI